MRRTKRALLTKDNPHVQQWSMQIVRQVRYRASQYNIPFNIDAEYILDRWTGVCPALGFTLRLDTKVTPMSPSLDRRIPALGYTKGNVVIISVRANSIKQDAIPMELRQVADWLERTTLEET